MTATKDPSRQVIKNGRCGQIFSRNKAVRGVLNRLLSESATNEKPNDHVDAAQLPDGGISDRGSVVDLGELPPTDHGQSSIGQFYTVPQDISSRILSHFFTKRFKTECEMAGSTSLMIRSPAVEVIQHLRELPEKRHPPPKFIFYGDDGRGKSLSLIHVIHYCFLADWFILPVPSVFSWVHGPSELQVSTYHAERFDQPEQANALLQMCKSINSKALAEVQLNNQYLFGRRDVIEKGEPLGKIIDTGLRRANYATDAVGVLLKEIRGNPSLRVLLAVNQFNGFFLKTTFKDAKQKWIKPKRLSLVHHFTELLHPSEGLKNGAMVFALSRTGMLRSDIKSYQIPDLIGKRGLSAVQDSINIEVPCYSKEELESCLQFYKERRILTKELNSQLTKEIAFLTAYEPPIVSHLCRRS